MKGSRQTTSVPVTTYKQLDNITISGISPEDALVLCAILRVVGGSPEGPRGASDRVLIALYEAGVRMPVNPLQHFADNAYTFPTMKGSITF